jgi:hypothetical protein
MQAEILNPVHVGFVPKSQDNTIHKPRAYVRVREKQTFEREAIAFDSPQRAIALDAANRLYRFLPPEKQNEVVLRMLIRPEYRFCKITVAMAMRIAGF